MDRFHGLDLDNHGIGHDQINAISQIDLFSFVNYWQSDLAGYRQALFFRSSCNRQAW